MANSIADNIPADLPLSSKVKGLRKEYEDAKTKLADYQRENSRYRTRDVSMVGELKARYSTPALVEAEKELKELEIQAVAAGKPLPDKVKHLSAVKAKMEEYDRTVSALKALVEQAHSAFSEAVKDDLVPMGLKEGKAAQKAREEWEKAEAAAIAARVTLEKNGALFVWCATSGGVDTLPLEGASAGNRAEYWNTNDTGMLTTEAAIELGFQGLSLIDGLVVMPAPVIDEKAEAEAKYWANYKGKIHNAKDSGYENSHWEF